MANEGKDTGEQEHNFFYTDLANFSCGEYSIGDVPMGEDVKKEAAEAATGFAQEHIAFMASDMVNDALGYVMEQFPDDETREELQERLQNILADGVNAALNGDDYAEKMEQGSRETAAWAAKHYTEKALELLEEELPEGEKRDIIHSNLLAISQIGIEAICFGKDWETVSTKLAEQAKNAASEYAKAQAKDTGKQIASQAIDSLAEHFKDKGRGKGRTRKNREIQAFSDTLKKNVAASIADSIDATWEGKELSAVGADLLKDTAKRTARAYIERGSKGFAKMAGESIAGSLKTSGKGSRKINHQIKNAQGIFVEELGTNLADNLSQVIDGDKTLQDAALDVATETARGTAEKYVKGYGAEIAAEAAKQLSKAVQKKVKDKAMRDLALRGCEALKNPDTLMKNAQAMIAIGGSVKRFLNGEITKAAMLQEIGEEGSGVVMASAFGTIGMMAGGIFAGPLGMATGEAVGSMIGYYANGMLYGAVVQAFEEAEASRERYAFIHEFCEESIRSMEEQRLRFEQETAELFANREKIINDSFAKMGTALKTKDFEALSEALNQIAESFGGELQFKTEEELDAFMDSDTNFNL